MMCKFIRVNAKTVVCEACKRKQRFSGDESRLLRECRICSHRGEKVGGVRVPCKGCKGQEIFQMLPIYGCSVWGTCTERPVESHRACKGCGDFHSAG